MELQQEYQQSELATQEISDSQNDSHDITAAQEQEMHDAYVDEALAPEREKAKSAFQEIVNETQQFIKNKFTRLDDVFFKKEAKKVYIKKEDEGNPTAGSHLDTQRGDIKYHIEGNWGIGHNYNILAKDGGNTYRIIVHHNEPDNYDMKVTVNNKPAEPDQAQKIATKYIGLL